jgi:hypothetical protein
LFFFLSLFQDNEYLSSLLSDEPNSPTRLLSMFLLPTGYRFSLHCFCKIVCFSFNLCFCSLPRFQIVMMTLNVEFRKAHINWDNLKFDFEPTDYMYFMN